MTPQIDAPPHTQTTVKIAASAEELSLIATEGAGGVIWQRKIPEGFQTWIEGLPPLNLPSTRAVLPPQKTRDFVTEVCDAADTPAGPNRDWLIDDVCFLADTFVRVMSAPFLQLRLDVVADDACRKFHVDMVRARLICTYRGCGTQYGVQIDGRDPQQVFEVQTGDPILLRGNLWPSQNPNRLRHRSPPIAGTGETRLILVLDAVETLEDPHTIHVSEPKRSLADLSLV